MAKHIKKYRNVLTRREQDSIRSKARGRAKRALSKKYPEEYKSLCGKIYRQLRREFVKLKGEKANDNL